MYYYFQTHNTHLNFIGKKDNRNDDGTVIDTESEGEEEDEFTEYERTIQYY